MTDEQCGHETPNGPCNNPATEDGHCWIESHGGDVTGHGRPSKLEDRKDDILTGARQGMTVEGCARLAGVSKDTLYRWVNEYDDFSDAFNRARAQGELSHIQSVNDRGSQFILERSFGYTKTEERKHEVEQTTKHKLADDEKEQLDQLLDRDPQE